MLELVRCFSILFKRNIHNNFNKYQELIFYIVTSMLVLDEFIKSVTNGGEYVRATIGKAFVNIRGSAVYLMKS